MKTTNFANLFAGMSISNTEDVVSAIAKYKSFIPTCEEEHTEAREALVNFITEQNTELEARAVSEVAKSDDIIKTLIPTLTLSEADKTKSFKRKMAVYLAVSYPQFAVERDTNANSEQYTVRKKIVPVTLAKVYKYLCEQRAFGHADNKVTKEDRASALAQIFNGSERALQLFCLGAFKYEHIAEKMPKIITLTEEEAKLYGGDGSKAKAEKHIKALAEALKIDGSFKRVHGLALYKKCYTLDAKLTPKTVDALTVLQSFIIVSRYAVNGLELPEVVDKGNVLFKDEAVDTDTTLTFS